MGGPRAGRALRGLLAADSPPRILTASEASGNDDRCRLVAVIVPRSGGLGRGASRRGSRARARPAPGRMRAQQGGLTTSPWGGPPPARLRRKEQRDPQPNPPETVTRALQRGAPPGPEGRSVGPRRDPAGQRRRRGRERGGAPPMNINPGSGGWVVGGGEREHNAMRDSAGVGTKTPLTKKASASRRPSTRRAEGLW